MRERRRPTANKGDAKIQRWIDLLASLLRRHFGATFEEIARDVPAYQDRRAKPDSILRTFERDKDELRAFGIPIETFTNAMDPTRVGYRLAADEFYLPYLLAITPSRVRPTPGHGYAGLESLVFAADELEAIGRAGELVRSLKDPVLLEQCGSAMRKLAFELPLDVGGP